MNHNYRKLINQFMHWRQRFFNRIKPLAIRGGNAIRDFAQMVRTSLRESIVLIPVVPVSPVSGSSVAGSHRNVCRSIYDSFARALYVYIRVSPFVEVTQVETTWVSRCLRICYFYLERDGSGHSAQHTIPVNEASHLEIATQGEVRVSWETSNGELRVLVQNEFSVPGMDDEPQVLIDEIPIFCGGQSRKTDYGKVRKAPVVALPKPATEKDQLARDLLAT